MPRGRRQKVRHEAPEARPKYVARALFVTSAEFDAPWAAWVARAAFTMPEISRSAIQHGHDLLLQGFSVSQVVHDYGDVCQAITELAVELDAPISTDDFRTLNRCLDDAIADAVTEYGRERNHSGIESARGSERLGFFAHELRNLTNTAIMAFEVLKTGDVGVGGSTGAVLHRSLMASRALISRSLAEVRLTRGIQNREQFPVAGFIEEIVSASTLDANARGVRLTVTPVEEGLTIEGDRHVLAAVVGNYCRTPSSSRGLGRP
jgi:signal transduction histidine kinase